MLAFGLKCDCHFSELLKHLFRLYYNAILIFFDFRHILVKQEMKGVKNSICYCNTKNEKISFWKKFRDFSAWPGLFVTKHINDWCKPQVFKWYAYNLITCICDVFGFAQFTFVLKKKVHHLVYMNFQFFDTKSSLLKKKTTLIMQSEHMVKFYGKFYTTWAHNIVIWCYWNNLLFFTPW